jgi:hypothetical protein
MKERHWNSLVATLRRGQCTLVLGPEFAACDAAGHVLPHSLAEALARTLADELDSDGRRADGGTLAAVAQQYEDSEGFGPVPLRAEAERFYRGVGATPSPVHHLLAALPFPLVLSTGHDTLFARALEQAGKSPVLQRYHLRADRRDNPEFLIPGTPQTPTVYHLFGLAGEPGSMVLSENDILDFLIAIVSENPPLPNCLLRALKKPGQSYLFLGFGIRHWHLRVLLKVILRSLGVGQAGSAVVAEPLLALEQRDREDTILFYRRGTRVEVEDAEIEGFLRALIQRFDAEGGYVGDPSPVGRRPRVFLCHASEDAALAARLHQALQAGHFEPWLDRQDLLGGEDWDRHIESELDATDFVLLLYSPSFAAKIDSYVNKELQLARRRALNVRGSFLIPLRTEPADRIEPVRELGDYNHMELFEDRFDEDVARVISTMKREMQRRAR